MSYAFSIVTICLGYCCAVSHATEMGDFTYEWLENLVRTEKIQSIDALLPKLPESFRAHYTLVRKSESSQGASPEFPRVIVFGQTARTIIAFNGHADHEGFRALEIITINEKTQRPEFREITFPGKAEGGQVQFSSPNPQRCQTCHGSPPRWIWAQYNQWPGFYGESDDFIEKDSDEHKSFLAFRKVAKEHSRYRHLNLGAEGDVKPFSLAVRDIQQRDESLRPNLRLGELLVRRAGRDVFAQLHESILFNRYAPLLLYEIAECPTKIPGEKLDERVEEDLYKVTLRKIGWRNIRGSRSRMGVLLEVLGLPRQTLIRPGLEKKGDQEFHHERLGLALSYHDGASSISEGVTALLWEEIAKDERAMKQAGIEKNLRKKFDKHFSEEQLRQLYPTETLQRLDGIAPVAIHFGKREQCEALKEVVEKRLNAPMASHVPVPTPNHAK